MASPRQFDELWTVAEPLFAEYAASTRAQVPPPNGELLHFTDPGAAIAILEHKVVRLSRARSSNDPLEVEHGLGVIRDEVEALRRQTDGDGFALGFLNSVRDFLKSGESLVWRESDRPFALRLPEAHAACFTENVARSNLLHWGLYGRDGDGIALVFNSTELSRRTGADLVQVGYAEDPFRVRVRNLVRSFSDLSGRLQAEGFRGPVREMLATSCVQLLGMAAATIKRSEFAPEREWRLLVHHSPMPGARELQFGAATTNNVIRTYYDFRFVPSAIQEIIIGARNASLNGPALRMWLDHHEEYSHVALTRGTLELR
jgi:hypothetical protein